MSRAVATARKVTPAQATSEDRAAPLLPTPEEARAAAEIAAPLTDENLRESVQKAVSLSLARGRANPPI